MRADRNSPEYI